uniref:DNA topoisomerase 2-binding protein 1 n=1 Tax=Steinernema glaseri TaxID=37863 RepID=A0A1I7Z2A4_9BILA
MQNFSDDPTLIYVIDLNTVTDEHTPEELQDAGNTYKALKEAGVGPRNISEEECLQVTTKRGAIFIFPIFRGKAFEHLKKLGCRLFGTPIVMQCLGGNARLPKEDFPVFSRTLDATVCCTGLRSSDRTALMEKVRWMGGRFQGDLTDKVTHLVAEECDPTSAKYREATALMEKVRWMGGRFQGDLTDKVTHLVAEECDPTSAKYREAVRMKIPVLTKDWIDEAWKHPFVNMTSEEFTEHYKVPIFSKLVISVSGLPVASRNEISRLIEHHGGVYSAELKRGKSTHLVVDKNCGDKLRRAKQWEIHIVTTKWIEKCVIHGVRLNERDYAPSAKLSRPLSRTLSTTTAPIADLDTSSPSNCSGVKTPSTSQENLRLLSIEQLVNRKLSGSGEKKLSQIQRKFATTDPIENVDTASLGTFNDCLTGCGVFVCGVTDENMVKWRRVLNITGASRCQDQDLQSSRVTHIVVGPHPVSEELLLQIKNRSHEVAVVTPEWLLQSAQRRVQVPLLEFMHPIFKNDGTENSSDVASLKRRGLSLLDDQSAKRRRLS